MTKTIAIEELQRFDNPRFNEDNARGLIEEMSSGLKLPESMCINRRKQCLQHNYHKL